MEIFLKLKHWQLFLIWLLGGIQLLFFIKSPFGYISIAIYFGLFYFWIYSIGKILNKNNSETIKQMNIWWIIFAFSFVPIIIDYRNAIIQSYNQINTWIIVVSGIIGFFSITKIVICTAKTLKRAESNKNYRTIDLLPEIFLIYFFIIGVWSIQPRINKIINISKNT